jgi:hypothetical protein
LLEQNESPGNGTAESLHLPANHRRLHSIFHPIQRHEKGPATTFFLTGFSVLLMKSIEYQ